MPQDEGLLKFAMCESVEVADGVHLGAMLDWSETQFSRFGFDVLAMMQGTYEVGRLSSFYGMGSSQWEKADQGT